MRGAIVIEGHIQGLSNTRSLGRLGVPVIVIDTKAGCLARFSRYCKRFFKCPEYSSDALADFLIQLADKYQLSGWMLLPSNDHAVMTIARHHERLKTLFRFMGPDQITAQRIYDKLELSKLASRLCVPVPLTFEAEEGNTGELPYPCIIKGRYGLTFYKSFGSKAMVCSSFKELNQYLKHPRLLADPGMAILQEVIPSTEEHHTISVASLSIGGVIKACWMGQKLREHPWHFGTATLTESIYVEALKPTTEALLKALNYTGISETEYLYDARTGQYKLIEINARTWLWSGHAAACGVDFVSLAYQYLMDKPVQWPENYTHGLKWRNFYPDLFFGVKAMAGGKIRFGAWLNQARGRKVPAVWNKRDPIPFFALTFMLPIIALQRTNP